MHVRKQTVLIKPIWPIYRLTEKLFEGSTTFVLKIKTVVEALSVAK
jgi:hypothetical protein